MRITGVDVILMDESHPDNTGWSPVVCRVYTDEGLYGDGEAAIAYSIGSKAAWSMVQEMGNRVLGMDPLENEVVWHNLYRTTFWAQNGGPIVWAGISAIDIALWDIKGNHFGVPVSTLLGGKMRSSLRCYASQLQFGWGTKKEPAATIEGYARNARAAVDEGYDAVKVDFFDFSPEGRFFTIEERTRLQPPQRLALVEERLAAVREAVGPDVDIIMENHANIDAQVAVQFGSLAQKYGVCMFEEPASPNPKITQFVSERVSVPIAHGERIYSRWGYAPYFENGSIQMIQPDLGNCGGITEGKKICDMASTYDVGVQAHVCGSPCPRRQPCSSRQPSPTSPSTSTTCTRATTTTGACAFATTSPKTGASTCPTCPAWETSLQSTAGVRARLRACARRFPTRPPPLPKACRRPRLPGGTWPGSRPGPPWPPSALRCAAGRPRGSGRVSSS